MTLSPTFSLLSWQIRLVSQLCTLQQVIDEDKAAEVAAKQLIEDEDAYKQGQLADAQRRSK